MTLTLKETKGGRGHFRGMAVALGIMMLVAMAVILLGASPEGGFFGMGSAGQSIPGVGNPFSMDTMKCAMSMSCGLTG